MYVHVRVSRGSCTLSVSVQVPDEVQVSDLLRQVVGEVLNAIEEEAVDE